ncbi:MAG: sodium:alanine symporter family protein [Ruminococcaceae bacterium]|nr:sodium:alanine symporter family protein [Oscillospiraceae bacterium]
MLFVDFINRINTVFSDNVLIFLLLGAGIYFTFKSRFVQIRCLGEGIKNTFSGLREDEKNEGVSPFAALATSLAAQLGTGNIVGAGAAVITGGPGAVFWMWVSAFFGMATAYYEAYFAIKSREIKDGEIRGGAAYYINEAFTGRKGRIIASLFSLFATVGLGFTGVAVQSNSIAVSLREALNIPVIVTGMVITIISGIIIFSGTKAVTKISEKTVPLMAFLYVGACVLVLILNIEKIPAAFSLIFRSAFSADALTGCILGLTLKTTLSQGVKRGLFTNEAGMGSSPAAHALSAAPSPHYQGTLGIAGVFTDTFVMLSLTALCVIIALFVPVSGDFSSLTGSDAATLSFAVLLGKRGAAVFIALSVLFFAFASVLGWNLYGKSSCTYLFGENSEKIYIISSLAFVFFGAVMTPSLAWGITDFMNTLMVITNIPALIMLVKRDSRT